MKAASFKDLEADNLLRIYVEAAALHGLSIEQADYRTTNEQADILMALYRELRSRGPEVQNCLLVLLNHENVSVRTWAACHAMDFAPEMGLQALESIASETGLTAFVARTALMEWREGKFLIP